MSGLTREDFNFFGLAQELGLHIADISTSVPESPGAYMLFSATGAFVYCGKATDLKDRVTYHFSPREENLLLRLLARYVIWETTANEEAASDVEGKLYDLWVEATGVPPLCNKVPPPKSKFSAANALRARLERLARLIASHRPKA